MSTKNQERSVDDAIHRAAAGAHSAVDKAESASIRAAGRVSETGQGMKEKQQEWMAGIDGYVQRNPMTSIGIAVAAGFVLSHLIRRRPQDDE